MLSSDEENQLSQASTADQAPSTHSSMEVEDPPSTPHGYLALARLMAETPSLAVYKRFGVLNALSLLFYQADLKKLEHQLLRQIRADYQDQDPLRKQFNTNWSIVSASDGQRKTINEIRDTMNKYNQEMLLQQQLLKLEKPLRRNIFYIRDWMRRGDMGNVDLKGPDQLVWRRNPLGEYVAIDAKQPDDALTRWITNFILGAYHNLIGRHILRRESENETTKSSYFYREESVTHTVSVIVIGLCSIFPISSILLLNYITDEGIRLTVLCVYTLAFSIILAAVSGARQLEVFSAAAAFAAVQVVFIGQNK